ncbi:hypothetical protein G9A89_004591 [Geosiphon pyriformis]|nr:hypothetical protein G9A89_004591 [Geosiphon pyriformis]
MESYSSLSNIKMKDAVVINESGELSLELYGMLVIVLSSTISNSTTLRDLDNRLVLNLLVSDWLQSFGFMMSLNWIAQGQIDNNSFCGLQGVIINISDISSGMKTFIPVVHAYEPKNYLKFSMIIIWSLSFFLSLLGFVIGNPGDPFYRSAGGMWCWIGENYAGYRIGFHYGIIVMLAFIMSILYGIMFWMLYRYRGRLQEKSANGLKLQRMKKALILYPVIYLIIVCPLASGAGLLNSLIYGYTRYLASSKPFLKHVLKKNSALFQNDLISEPVLSLDNNQASSFSYQESRSQTDLRPIKKDNNYSLRAAKRSNAKRKTPNKRLFEKKWIERLHFDVIAQYANKPYCVDRPEIGREQMKELSEVDTKRLTKGVWEVNSKWGNFLRLTIRKVFFQQILQLMRQKKPETLNHINLIGHGVGGVYAQILSILLDDHLSNIMPGSTYHISIFTFGSPRVGNSQFAMTINLSNKITHFRFTHSNDFAPHFPATTGRNYLHSEGEHWIVPKNCDCPSDEDYTLYNCPGYSRDDLDYYGENSVGKCDNFYDWEVHA